MNNYEALSPRERSSVPSPGIKNQLLAVEIPQACLVNCNGVMRMKEIDQYYQLTVLGARTFRTLAANEFWRDLSTWIQEGKADFENDMIAGIRITKKDMIQKFMSYYGIDTEHLETIYRNFHRVECSRKHTNP